MKLGFIADLHIDINKNRKRTDIIETLFERAVEKKLDALCLGGDISNDYQMTLATIKKIEDELNIPCYFVAGNHDLWNVHYPNLQTWDIYNELKKHPRNLANGVQQLKDGWVLLGDIGWYDFSFGNDQKYSRNDFVHMKMKGSTWKDKEYTDWAKQSLNIHHFFVKYFEEMLSSVKGQNIIFCTHVVSHHLFTVPTPHRIWDYFNAFLGSKDYERLIKNYSVKFALCGHVHYRKKVQESETQFICSSLGYVNQWRFNSTIEEIEHALTIIEIE